MHTFVRGTFNILAKRGETGMASTTIYYAQVPLFLRINGGSRSTGGISLYGIVGPAIDLKIGEDLGDITNLDEIESVDMSLVAGAGVELARFILEARGTWGLRNIAAGTEGVEVKTRTFALLLGLRFN